MGFADFPGSTVVHSTGASIALVRIWVLGPRLGHYDEKGELIEFKCYKKPYAILGVLILWLDWWGFKGSSQLVLDQAVSSIILNTTLGIRHGGGFCFSADQNLGMSPWPVASPPRTQLRLKRATAEPPLPS